MIIHELKIEPVLGKAKISFLTNDLTAVDNLLHIDAEKPLEANITPIRDTRSVNANSYLWVLCDKIAQKVHSTKEDVYRMAIRECGVWQDVACTTESLPSLIETWTSRGIGWLVDTFDSKLDGCKRVRLYTGSHTYDTKEMSRIIDFIVHEAKDLDIETMTPEQLGEMLNASSEST